MARRVLVGPVLVVGAHQRLLWVVAPFPCCVAALLIQRRTYTREMARTCLGVILDYDSGGFFFLAVKMRTRRRVGVVTVGWLYLHVWIEERMRIDKSPIVFKVGISVGSLHMATYSPIFFCYSRDVSRT